MQVFSCGDLRLSASKLIIKSGDKYLGNTASTNAELISSNISGVNWESVTWNISASDIDEMYSPTYSMRDSICEFVCGLTFMKTNGFLLHPGAPKSYIKNIRCKNTIQCKIILYVLKRFKCSLR